MLDGRQKIGKFIAVIILFTSVYAIGCKSGQQGGSTANTPPASVPARVVEPLTFVPPKSDSDAADSLDTLRKAGENFKDYKLSRTRTQIQLQDVSVAVVNQLVGFTDPVTSSSPGRYEMGGEGRYLKKDEIEKVTDTVRKSTIAYLNNRFRVTDGARFEVVVIIWGHPGVRILNGFDPYGTEDFITLFIDTQSKLVIWSTSREAYGKTLDSATDAAANGVPKQLDILFGIDKKQ